MKQPANFVPNLVGRVDSVTEQALRDYGTRLNALEQTAHNPPAGATPNLTPGPGINITKGQVGLTNVGPGAGTYTVGAKLTGGGQNGQITIDNQGRITKIQQAT